MADYWRFQERAAPAAAHVKRPRAEFEEVPQAGLNYAPLEEPRYDAQDGRFSWMEANPVGMDPDANRSQMPYAPGNITGSEMAAGAGVPYISSNGAAPISDSKMGFPSFNDQSVAPQGARMMVGMDLGVHHGLNGGRLDHVPQPNPQIRGLPGPGMAPPDATNTLYVKGLPADCTRREAAHIFRPFLGYKEVRLVRKEGKHDGDQFVLCFVDFLDPKSASVALEALQGYKFDETERDPHTLRLQYSRFPGGSRPGPRDGARGPRDAFPPDRPFRAR